MLSIVNIINICISNLNCLASYERYDWVQKLQNGSCNYANTNIENNFSHQALADLEGASRLCPLPFCQCSSLTTQLLMCRAMIYTVSG